MSIGLLLFALDIENILLKYFNLNNEI